MPFTSLYVTDTNHTDTAAFLVVHRFTNIDADSKIATFIVRIYRSEPDFDNRATVSPTKQMIVSIINGDFDIFFPESELRKGNRTPITQAEDWLEIQTNVEGINLTTWTKSKINLHCFKKLFTLES